VFNRTHPHGEVWHGHVRTWEQVRGGTDPLNQDMKNALVKSERVVRNGGKIIDAPNWAPEQAKRHEGRR
jgi:hypothetical protein